MDVNLITTPNLQVHQVKGIRYLLSDFLGCSVPHDLEFHIFSWFLDPTHKLYTITLYLSPSDYHRVHSPCSFSIHDRVHFPGKLLPVKNYFVQNVKSLFTINERVVLTGTWNQGFFSLGMVWAYNVGSISLANSQDCDLRTNRMRGYRRRNQNYCYRKHYSPSVDACAGDLVGTFHVCLGWGNEK